MFKVEDTRDDKKCQGTIFQRYCPSGYYERCGNELARISAASNDQEQPGYYQDHVSHGKIGRR
jgi:hypothetical protein